MKAASQGPSILPGRWPRGQGSCTGHSGEHGQGSKDCQEESGTSPGAPGVGASRSSGCPSEQRVPGDVARYETTVTCEHARASLHTASQERDSKHRWAELHNSWRLQTVRIDCGLRIQGLAFCPHPDTLPSQSGELFSRDGRVGNGDFRKDWVKGTLQLTDHSTTSG